MAKVLICDDAMYMRLTLRKILEESGFEVVGEAKDGMDAVAQYELLQPDIVTMDIIMPVQDGVSAVREIMEKYPHAKIVMVSSIGKKQLVSEAIKAGAKSFLLKPFKKEAVGETLMAVLKG